MTVDSIPAGKSDPGKVESPRTSLNKQLQQEGLRQAREFQQSTQSVQLSVSQTAVSNKVVVTAMEQNVVVNERRFDNSQYANAAPEASKSLFDFETVANNVLKFVGGVVRGAAKSGADDETLTDLIGQARSGVAKGIAMAQKDLAGLMNSEISQGIEKSREAIGNGINELEDEVLGKSEAASGIMAQQLFAQNMNAEQAGLVQYVVDDEKGMEDMLEYLSSLAFANSPSAVADAKRLFHALEDEAISKDTSHKTAKHAALRWERGEAQEGIAALLEDRKPGWADRS